MNRFELFFKNEIDSRLLDSIIELKQQYWNYDYVSQKKWIDRNLMANDIHAVLFFEDKIKKTTKLISYLDIVQLMVEIDDVKYEMYGIGNVCVNRSNEHRGYAKALLKHVCNLQEEYSNKGILLCKKQVEPFYEKCGWKKIYANVVEVAKEQYQDSIMLYDKDNDIKIVNNRIVINRFF